MIVTAGPLVWPMFPPGAPDDTDPPPTTEQWAAAVSASLEWLWAVSGRQFGTRTTVYRPSARMVGNYTTGALSFLQSIYGPLWAPGGPREGDPVLRRILELPGPVDAGTVPSVTIVDSDGTTHRWAPASDPPADPAPDDPATAYRLEGPYLVRTDDGTWPDTQNLVANMGDPNTWQVDYVRGVRPPMAGQLALAALAREWVKDITGDPKCRLPWNTQAVSRGGVSVKLDVSTTYRTCGIAQVDRWVLSVNPNALQSQPQVWSPDVDRNGPAYAGSYSPAP